MGNPVVHFEIGCPDTGQAQTFYSSLFDWDVKGEAGSASISTGAAEGIPGHITSLGHEPHNYVNVYVQVDDVAATLAKVEQLGGKRLVGPLEVPDGSGTFAWFEDPGGTTLGLWKPAT